MDRSAWHTAIDSAEGSLQAAPGWWHKQLVTTLGCCVVLAVPDYLPFQLSLAPWIVTFAAGTAFTLLREVQYWTAPSYSLTYVVLRETPHSVLERLATGVAELDVIGVAWFLESDLSDSEIL